MLQGNGSAGLLRMADVFHTGWVVPDIGQAVEQHRAIFATEWTDIVERSMAFRGPEGPFTIQMRLAFTRDGPFRLELIEAVPGSIWEAPTSSTLGNVAGHHLGMWSDDIVAQSHALGAAGCPLLATYDTDGVEVSHIAYHRMPNGTIVELVDTSARSNLESWWAGNAAFPGSAA